MNNPADMRKTGKKGHLHFDISELMFFRAKIVQPDGELYSGRNQLVSPAQLEKLRQKLAECESCCRQAALFASQPVRPRRALVLPRSWPDRLLQGGARQAIAALLATIITAALVFLYIDHTSPPAMVFKYNGQRLQGGDRVSSGDQAVQVTIKSGRRKLGRIEVGPHSSIELHETRDGEHLFSQVNLAEGQIDVIIDEQKTGELRVQGQTLTAVIQWLPENSEARSDKLSYTHFRVSEAAPDDPEENGLVIEAVKGRVGVYMPESGEEMSILDEGYITTFGYSETSEDSVEPLTE